MRICVNVGMADYERLKSVCKTFSLTKRQVIIEAVNWQYDNLETSCLSYIPGARRTATLELDEVEMHNIKQLADYMQCTPAQVGLISLRNFIAANQEGTCDYFKKLGVGGVSQDFGIIIPSYICDAVTKAGLKISKEIRNCLRACAHVDKLPQLRRTKKGEGWSPKFRAYLEQDDAEIIRKLMIKFNDSRAGVIARCMAKVHIWDKEVDDGTF
jgi:hypothetical protein